jgi:hypothetical protein
VGADAKREGRASVKVRYNPVHLGICTLEST